MCFNGLLNALECTNFLKSILGMKMNHLKKLFMNNEYKHEQNGSPRSNFKNLDVVKALCQNMVFMIMTTCNYCPSVVMWSYLDFSHCNLFL